MIGIVQTNIGTTMSQVYSRLFILWGVIEGFPQASACTYDILN